MESKWMHIFPTDDLRKHDTEGHGCWCEPWIDWDDMLVIHHSIDGREAIDEAEEIIKGGQDDAE